MQDLPKPVWELLARKIDDPKTWMSFAQVSRLTRFLTQKYKRMKQIEFSKFRISKTIIHCSSDADEKYKKKKITYFKATPDDNMLSNYEHYTYIEYLAWHDHWPLVSSFRCKFYYKDIEYKKIMHQPEGSHAQSFATYEDVSRYYKSKYYNTLKFRHTGVTCTIEITPRQIVVSLSSIESIGKMTFYLLKKS